LDAYKTKQTKANEDAYYFLTMSCTGEPAEYVWAAEGNALLAWKNLEERYGKSEELDVIALIEEFNECVMEEATKDPKLWFAQLGVSTYENCCCRWTP
jgi:hypothetical protein